MIKAILFDLDGTLADTALDLGGALNRLLAEEGQPPVPYEKIRPIASHGARGLVELGFGLHRNDPGFDALRLRFLDHYEDGFQHETVLFEGINALLETLAARGIKWGIITNKPMRFTDRLVPALGFSIAPAVVVSGDTVGVAKPDPRPMQHACEQIGVDPSQCWYVGDAERDIVAGRAVGMKTVLAGYGYIAETDRPEEWGADLRIAHPLELLALLPIQAV
ncbi:HAD family hydrolase [Chitinimonas sp. BJB300]|uniref:HAD family hydrolase n=1 Tax=Chitinimonas sp. BJB300 TaxID=1559339 RepID=UPI000C0DE6BE|nr:HAD-IA family hydrolase [Chitinimonas sp. BJB300]PHV11768.1 phosphoglycolate phosphatase [Chitinimonas sp. BJB300]TSJ87092.1 HAD-IA family hydrolase [Chitinimonas sp. BJB300]